MKFWGEKVTLWIAVVEFDKSLHFSLLSATESREVTIFRGNSSQLGLFRTYIKPP